MNTIRIGVVEPQDLMREGLAALICLADGLDCVGAWQGECQLLAALTSVKPDVLLYGMGSEIPSISPRLLHFAQSTPAMQIVVLVDCPKNCSCDPDPIAMVSNVVRTPHAIQESQIDSGNGEIHNVCGCVAKDFPARAVFGKKNSFATLKRVIRQVHQSREAHNGRGGELGAEIPAAVLRYCAVERNGLSVLSERELQVALLVAGGLANKAISQQLGVSYSTVKNHVSSILQKLKLDHRTQLALFALSHGATGDIGIDSINLDD